MAFYGFERLIQDYLVSIEQRCHGPTDLRVLEAGNHLAKLKCSCGFVITLTGDAVDFDGHLGQHQAAELHAMWYANRPMDRR